MRNLIVTCRTDNVVMNVSTNQDIQTSRNRFFKINLVTYPGACIRPIFKPYNKITITNLRKYNNIQF